MCFLTEYARNDLAENSNLGFAGVGFIVFGIIWDTLTRGAWVNDDSRSFSRTSRAFLYLGYVILTATLVNWALTTHDLTTLNALTGKAAMAGYERFGLPMLYVIYVLTLSRVIKPEDTFSDT